MLKAKFEHTEYGILFDGPAFTCESMEHVDAHFQSLKGQLASLTSWQMSLGAFSSTNPSDIEIYVLRSYFNYQHHRIGIERKIKI